MVWGLGGKRELAWQGRRLVDEFLASPLVIPFVERVWVALGIGGVGRELVVCVFVVLKI